MRTLTKTIGSIALIGGLLAGCGGDDGDEVTGAGETTEAVESPAGEDDASEEDASEEDASEDDASEEEPASEEGDGDFCAGIEDVEVLFQELDGAEEPDAALFGELSSAFEGIAEDAPDEIAEDIETLAEALRRVSEIVERLDPNDPSSGEEVEAELAAIEEDLGDVEATTDRVAAYAEEECGVDLDSGDDTDTATETELDETETEAETEESEG